MKKIFLLLLCAFCLQITYSQDLLIAKSPDSTHNSVVAIMRFDSTGKLLTRATGVLIHPGVILTAGHVRFVNTYPDGLKREGLISLSNQALETKDYISFDWIDDVETHPDQENFLKSRRDTTGKFQLGSYFDIGLIYLKEPVQNKPIAKLPPQSFFQTLPANVSFIGVGYGYHKLRESSFKYSYIDGKRRKWKPQSVAVINDKWLSGSCDSTTKQQFSNVGDSGAPIFIDDNTIIGILSAAPRYPDTAKFVRLDNKDILDWIRKAVKNRLGIDL